MKVLYWDEVKKARQTEEHNEYQADGAPPGTYRNNMSEEDEMRWRAKKIGGKDPRVEVRTSLPGANLVIVVRPDEMKISANGPMYFNHVKWEQFIKAIQEAKVALL